MATVNYATTTAIGASLGNAINPSFIVRRTAPIVTDLISGLFPILNTSLLVLTLRAILGSGTITIAGELELTAGDTLGLFYNASALTISIDLGGNDSGIVWSMHRIT
ncbi:hypothetical protein D3C77_482460 [compost metagenome]